LKTVYLSLGSNLGDRAAHLRKAIQHLEAGGIHIARSSTVYETQPQDVVDQPWFLNLVVEAETRLYPMQLLAKVLKTERELGRIRAVPKGPRVIDIDILLYGKAVIETAGLTVPHPRLTERRFVLEPLAELVPDLRHPVTRQIVRELLGSVAAQVVRKFEP
jgi:2-amino-4-hydroxy-6-hydroxymethyldihydropteridine diphosphokinase